MGKTGTIIDVIEGQAFPRSEEVGCPICGRYSESRKISVRFGMIAMVAECPDCRVAFQTPRPSVEASLAYMNWRWQSSDAYVADSESQMQRALRQAAFVKQYFDKPINLVDFGAGTGSFVRAALDQGWNATGIEQSHSAIAIAKELHNIELRKEFAGEQYNVATMWDVVEHLRDLQGTLSLIGEHLVEDGLLFISTGNFENWVRLVENDRWDLYLFDHQFYFSPSSLKQVLHSAGYSDSCLLDVNRSRPSINPKRIVRHPIRSILSWLGWAIARARWPAHGDINIMVAVARKKAGLTRCCT